MSRHKRLLRSTFSSGRALDSQVPNRILVLVERLVYVRVEASTLFSELL